MRIALGSVAAIYPSDLESEFNKIHAAARRVAGIIA